MNEEEIALVQTIVTILLLGAFLGVALRIYLESTNK